METTTLHSYAKPSHSPQSPKEVEPAQEIDLDGPEGSLGENNWLLRCPEARAAVEQGIAESKLGLGVKMSFLEYADLEIED